MKFQTQLNAYIQQLDCLAKDLSAASGLSPATLSRYRSGERLPDPNAPALGSSVRASPGWQRNGV